MGRLFDAGYIASIAEQISETLFRQRLATIPTNEMRIAGRTSFQRDGKAGMQRDRNLSPRLERLEPFVISDGLAIIDSKVRAACAAASGTAHVLQEEPRSI